MIKSIQYMLFGLLCIFATQSNGQGISTDSLESKIQKFGEYSLHRNHRLAALYLPGNPTQ